MYLEFLNSFPPIQFTSIQSGPITVLEFPPRLSLSSCVSTLLRYGTNPPPSRREVFGDIGDLEEVDPVLTRLRPDSERAF